MIPSEARKRATEGEAELDALLTPEAVRRRCGAIFQTAEHGALPYFRLDLDRLRAAVALVRRVTEETYPDGRVPLHSRWRHFETAAGDLWSPLAARLEDPTARLRARVDLAVVSVLLDAGAGAAWRYCDRATGCVYRRSEGLAVASLRLFEAGTFSRDPRRDPLRVDAETLVGLDAAALAEGFQADDDNSLVGVEARADLLVNLGRRMTAHGAFRGDDGSLRPGHLADVLLDRSADGVLPARDILLLLLEALNPIWPGGLVISGRPLGDVGRHPLAGGTGAGAGLVPFHKLSQWLAYSLIEPLEEAGVTVTDADGLTGLPEYRNGGLFIDTGVLQLADPAFAEEEHADDGTLVVEWRALTVCLLDRLADQLRAELGASVETLPLARVLQGGTWAAGRRLAYARSPDGDPPIPVAATGSLF